MLWKVNLWLPRSTELLTFDPELHPYSQEMSPGRIDASFAWLLMQSHLLPISFDLSASVLPILHYCFPRLSLTLELWQVTFGLLTCNCCLSLGLQCISVLSNYLSKWQPPTALWVVHSDKMGFLSISPILKKTLFLWSSQLEWRYMRALGLPRA